MSSVKMKSATRSRAAVDDRSFAQTFASLVLSPLACLHRRVFRYTTPRRRALVGERASPVGVEERSFVII